MAKIDERVVAVNADIRSLLNDYFEKNGEISSEQISKPSLIGKWNFVPADKARKALEEDMSRMTPMR